jgi:hypothetical protein
MISEYPSNFIPKDAKILIGVDYGKDGTTTTVKGFFKDGVYHIQEIETKPDTARKSS